MPAQRKVLSSGHLGGGTIVCDGESHWMIREQYKELNCERETFCGKCNFQIDSRKTEVITGEKISG